jgi:hypothetical protein
MCDEGGLRLWQTIMGTVMRERPNKEYLEFKVFVQAAELSFRNLGGIGGLFGTTIMQGSVQRAFHAFGKRLATTIMSLKSSSLLITFESFDTCPFQTACLKLLTCMSF